MGKVGSTSIYHSLRSQLDSHKVRHVHFLSDYYLNEVLPNTRHTWNIDHGKSVLEEINSSPRSRIKIITVMREPLAREISNIFQNPQDYTESDLNELSDKELIDLSAQINLDYTLGWFDQEFKSFTNVDILDLESPSKEGFSINSTDKFDILLLRLEDLSAIGEEALKRFTGQKIKLVLSNKGVDKQSGERYRFFKQHMSFSLDSLRLAYDHPIVKFFYTQKELDEFMSRWKESMRNSLK